MSMQRACRHYGVSRQGLYQRRDRARQRAGEQAQVLAAVATVRTRLPRLGTRKLLHKIAPLLRAQQLRCGRDGLFALLRQHGQLVAPKRRYTKTLVAVAELGFVEGRCKAKSHFSTKR